nr:hypothetical protein [uncultured Bdellovibrio sp.]
MRTLSVAVFAAALSAGIAVQAVAPKGQDLSYYKKLNAAAPTAPVVAAPDVTVPTLKQIIEKSESRRSPAQAGNISEAQMSPELREIRDRFFKVKTSDELAQMLSDLDANYDKLPNDAKFFAAQILPAQALRGFVFRAKSVFEKRSPGVHSAVLTVAKNTATNFRIYLPQDNMAVVEEYFMSPYYENGKLVSTFNDEADIQGWLAGPFREQILKADERLGKLNLSEPVVWDQRFSFGPDSFKDGVNRFRLIGELEKSMVRSAMMTSVASLSFLRAYNIRGSIDLSRDLGRLYGVDGFLSQVDGVSARKITNTINKYPQIGTLLPDGEAWMKSSLNASRWAVAHAWSAWQASSESRKNENLYAIDSGYWRVNRHDVEQNLELLYRVVASDSSEKMRSSVTGEVIEIRYADFFNKPPKDLKAFLPTAFDTRSKVTREAVVDTKGSKKALTYRNYAEGSPEKWNVSAYSPYFPSVKKDDDVFKSVRVLSHSGGNWLNITR